MSNQGIGNSKCEVLESRKEIKHLGGMKKEVDVAGAERTKGPGHEKQPNFQGHNLAVNNLTLRVMASVEEC